MSLDFFPKKGSVYYDIKMPNNRKLMKTHSPRHKCITETGEALKLSSAKQTGTFCKAYGDKVSICINTDCMLRKKAGGCLGFEGCPGFKSR